MYVWVRTANIASGKAASAFGWAKEMVDFIRARTGSEVEVLRPIAGNPFRIAFAVRDKDLAAMEAQTKRLAADPHYTDLLAKGPENFVPSSAFGAIWEVI